MTLDVADTELKASHRAMWASGDYPLMVDTLPAAASGRGSSDACGDRPGVRVLDVAAGTGNASHPGRPARRRA